MRVGFIQEKLRTAALGLRRKLDATASTVDLIDDPIFKQWVVINEVLTNSANNDTFARMLYYLYEECNKDLLKLLSYYDIDFQKNDEGGIGKITLVTLEVEDEQE